MNRTEYCSPVLPLGPVLPAGTGSLFWTGTLPLGPVRVYSFAMIQLPASYQEYLVGKSESFINTVRPVLMQSAADKLHGVRVVVHPHDHQAHLDETLPFGTILEDID